MSVWEALPILKNGILACLITALVCSFLGVYVILKRVVFMTAALSQASSLGIAVALLFGIWMDIPIGEGGTAEPTMSATALPMFFAILFACAAASLLASLHTERRLTRESLLGIAYAIPAALTLLILDRIGGATYDINNLLFGNAVFISSGQLIFLAISAAVVLLIHGVLYKEFIFVSFDYETAKACGMRTLLLNQILFYSMAVMISVSINSIGVLPVFSFMVIPAAAALMLTQSLKQTFILATLFGGIAALAGFYLSFEFSLPTGPAMIAVASLLFLPGVIKSILTRT